MAGGEKKQVAMIEVSRSVVREAAEFMLGEKDPSMKKLELQKELYCGFCYKHGGQCSIFPSCHDRAYRGQVGGYVCIDWSRTTDCFY